MNLNMNISVNSPLSLQAPVREKPSIVVLSPFTPKIMSRLQLESSLKGLLEKAEGRLMSAHSAEDALPIVRRLRQQVRKLDYGTHKNSIAIFVSEDVEKVCYMNMEVEPQLIIDEPFRVRDLAERRPTEADYLVLVLSSKQCKTYLGHGRQLRLIKSNTPQVVYAYLNEVPERTANFSDPDSRKEVVLNKFLHHMDLGLGAVLKAYPLPVFILGSSRVTGHFDAITQHGKNIAAYIHKNGADEEEHRLAEWLEPELAAWHQTKQQMILRQVEKAQEAGKLVVGVDNLKNAAGSRNNRLLVIERDPSIQTPRLGRNEDAYPFYKDGTIDDIAEKVLAAGGDLEIVDKGTLAGNGPAALIRYY